ncbi:MAG: S8 family serine peptidase [Rhodopila sp.]
MPVPSLSASIEELLDQANAENRGFYTGRYLVTYKQDAHSETAQRLRFSDDTRIASAEDFSESAIDFTTLGNAQSLMLPQISVAVVTPPADGAAMVTALAADESGLIESVDPETFVFIASDSWRHYLRGFAAASDRIRQDLIGAEAAPVLAPETEFEQEAVTADVTWGLVATRVTASRFSGRGIKVAVLDTGFDLSHPDFAGRSIVSATFVGQPVQDRHGHGTHCIGTACGPRAPVGVPRYGIAYESQIFAGKVLSNGGSSVGGSVLAGMNWAVANRCEVISMSLEGPGGPVPAFTNAGRAALDAGCLMVAAAGNESRRPTVIAPTGSPANSPTIISVAAVDERLNVAPFSNGGKVEIAGPGVNVLSSWIMPKRYNTISGTSMATPHVAGVASLFAQSNPGLRGRALWEALTARARHLPLPPRDVGAGLVQAP